jgi:hypothetical protein
MIQNLETLLLRVGTLQHSNSKNEKDVNNDTRLFVSMLHTPRALFTKKKKHFYPNKQWIHWLSFACMRRAGTYPN